MASDNRQSSSIVSWMHALVAEPRRFHIFSALRIVECYFSQQPRLGTAARSEKESVRLLQQPYLAHPVSDIDGLDSTSADKTLKIRTLPLGLFGPGGPLPLHLTEHALLRVRWHQDDALTGFADIFHHRLLSLWYRAWADVQPVVCVDRSQEDSFGGYLDALTGVKFACSDALDALPQSSRRFYAGRFVAQTRHCEGLVAVLRGVLGVHLHINPWQISWLKIPSLDRALLGTKAASLGHTLTMGKYIRDGQSCIGIVIGPVRRSVFQQFFPAGVLVELLVAVVRNYLGDCVQWSAQIVLQRTDIPEPRLGRQSRMGMSLWIGNYTRDVDPTDFVIHSSAYYH